MADEQEGLNGAEAGAWTEERELEIAFSGPAVFANRFWVTFDANTARISFMERSATGAEQHFRTAVAMSLPDLVSLRDLLTELLPQGEDRPGNGGDGH